MHRIGDFLSRDGIEVIIVDPLYLTLLSGTEEVSAADLYQMVRIFGDVAEAIIKEGATPILAHHFKKTVGKEDTDPDLGVFSFVGAAESARQSLLIGRLGSYTGPRNNQLVIRTHGFGRGDRFRVHIDEGTLEQPLWRVMIEREQATTAREK